MPGYGRIVVVGVTPLDEHSNGGAINFATQIHTTYMYTYMHTKKKRPQKYDRSSNKPAFIAPDKSV
jgi:hypothetical protein